MSNVLDGPPEDGELVVLEVKKPESLPQTLQAHFSVNPQLVAYRGQDSRGVWFQLSGATLEGELGPTGERRDWGPFSFFLPWKRIATILRLEDRPPARERAGFGAAEAKQ